MAQALTRTRKAIAPPDPLEMSCDIGAIDRAIDRARTNKAIFVPGTEHRTKSGIGGTSLLACTDKMPCKSFSLPAKYACPGNLVHVPGSPCWKCYAYGKGHYAKRCVQRAQWRRFKWTIACLETPEGTDAWVRLMIAAIRAWSRGVIDPVFRWHDSGDFFNREYARACQRVVAGTPEINHWFPTQSHRVAIIAVVLREICELDNVVIRPSCEQVDAPAVVVPGLSAGTQVVTSPKNVQAGAWLCPAQFRPGDKHGKCMECRVCFVERERVVAYMIHTT